MTSGRQGLDIWADQGVMIALFPPLGTSMQARWHIVTYTKNPSIGNSVAHKVAKPPLALQANSRDMHHVRQTGDSVTIVLGRPIDDRDYTGLI